MTSGSNQEPLSAAERERQLEALYGPAGRADHQRGETITFSSSDTGNRVLTGEILYVRAPGPAIVGGRSHPTTYIVSVKDAAFPYIVYPADVIEQQDKNSSS